MDFVEPAVVPVESKTQKKKRTKAKVMELLSQEEEHVPVVEMATQTEEQQPEQVEDQPRMHDFVVTLGVPLLVGVLIGRFLLR